VELFFVQITGYHGIDALTPAFLPVELRCSYRSSSAQSQFFFGLGCELCEAVFAFFARFPGVRDVVGVDVTTVASLRVERFFERFVLPDDALEAFNFAAFLLAFHAASPAESFRLVFRFVFTHGSFVVDRRVVRRLIAQWAYALRLSTGL